MLTIKFGGSSIADADKLINTLEIVKDKSQQGKVFVVYSAVFGVTDQLMKMTEQAGVEDALAYVEKLASRYESILMGLLPQLGQVAKDELANQIQLRFEQLRQWLSFYFLTTVSEQQRTMIGRKIVTTGERLSVDITLMIGRSMGMVVSRLAAEKTLCMSQGAPDMAASSRALGTQLALLDNQTQVFIMEGFYGRNEFGEIETLGRNASDLSSVVLGHLTGAKQIEIFSDQDGICIADPRLIANAPIFAVVSFSQARLLSQLGASIIHHSSISNNFAMTIPVWIKNASKPYLAGTEIAVDDGEKPLIEQAKGLCCVFDIAIVSAKDTANGNGNGDGYWIKNNDLKKCNDPLICPLVNLVAASPDFAVAQAADYNDLGMLSFCGLNGDEQLRLQETLVALGLKRFVLFNGHFDGVSSVLVSQQQLSTVANTLYQALQQLQLAPLAVA